MTGTDTEVGKTMVTAALASAMRQAGIPVQAIKPMATGGPSPGEDAEFIAEAAGHPRNPDYNGTDQEGIVRTQASIRYRYE